MQRFRITPWPSLVQAPKAVAVPRFAGVVDIVWDEWPADEQTWLDLSALANCVVTTGPTRHLPHSGAPLDSDLAQAAQLYADRDFLADHPGAEDGLIQAGSRLDNPPAVVFENQPPRLIDLPEELFLRGFLAIDGNDPASVVSYLGKWGPLIEPHLVEQSDVVQLVPKAWQQYSVEHDERRSPPKEIPEQLKELYLRSASFEEIAETRRRLQRVELDEVARGAAVNPLDAVLDQPWRLMTELRIELNEMDVRDTTGEEGEDYSFPLGQGRGVLSARPYSLALQMWLVRVYQAVFESWVLLETATDLSLRQMAQTPRKPLVAAWASRGLPAPTTTFEAVTTIQSFINEATSVSGPRLELGHPLLDAQSGAYGRPVPRILTAMCLQLLAWVSEGVPARRCVNETCGQWFTRQRGRAAYGQYRTAGVIYCSSSCAKAQAQREYRRRRRYAM